MHKLEQTEADLIRKLEQTRLERSVKKTQLSLYEVGRRLI